MDYSQVSFRDATWPMLLMTFLAFAGYNFHPILLRGIIWMAHKVGPAHMRDSLKFLLDHPRRCYTLLFPHNATWVLLGILVILNLADVLLIILLDLNNEEVRSLSPGLRVLAALFQAASARHTGTSTFDLADLNPAVQFSLVTMMYIAAFPIAMIVRSSNTYEERALGIHHPEPQPDDTQGPLAYLTRHARNQLGFDLWYIFLGAFCICIAEAGRIVDRSDVEFSEFSILFECTSAYANVGLSLGTKGSNTSLSGDFSVFSKLVVCAMMWRGRHRGLPYDLDYAVMLPGDLSAEAAGSQEGDAGLLEDWARSLPVKGSGLKRAKTA
jgi:potassium uptake Trk family protein